MVRQAVQRRRQHELRQLVQDGAAGVAPGRVRRRPLVPPLPARDASRRHRRDHLVCLRRRGSAALARADGPQEEQQICSPIPFPPSEDSVSYADSHQVTIAKVRRVSRGLAPAVVHELAKVAQRGRLVGFSWVRARHEEHACILGRPRRAAVLCTRHNTQRVAFLLQAFLQGRPRTQL